MKKLIFLVLSIVYQVLALSCTAKDIIDGKVKSCDCYTEFITCKKMCISEKYGLKTCGDCGQKDNYDCDSCVIYYGELGVCGCLKELINKTDNCIGSKLWNGIGPPPIWTLQKGNNPLILSTVLNTGLENLATMPEKDGGWELGMMHMDHKTQALTMNSQSSRGQNQVHIHICPKLTSAEAVLSGLKSDSYNNISPVIGTMNWPPKGVDVFCEANNSPTPSTSIVEWYKTHLNSTLIAHVGIGLLTDTYGNWWTCASIGGTAQFGVFCR